MEKNKQNKKLKPKTKLISIAMLAIILVSMLAVPTSAVEGDSLRGVWTVYNDYEYSSNFPQTAVEMDVVGLMPWYVNGQIIQIPLNQIVVQYWSGDEDNESNIIVYGEYNGNNVRIFYNGDDRGIYLATAPNWASSTEILKSQLPEVYNSLLTFTVESSTTGDFSLLEQYASFEALPAPEPDPLGNILDVFLGIGGWIATAVTSLIGIFYSAEAGKLTVIGVLSVASLSISVIFLLIGVIQNFMHFRS